MLDRWTFKTWSSFFWSHKRLFLFFFPICSSNQKDMKQKPLSTAKWMNINHTVNNYTVYNIYIFWVWLHFLKGFWLHLGIWTYDSVFLKSWLWLWKTFAHNDITDILWLWIFEVQYFIEIHWITWCRLYNNEWINMSGHNYIFTFIYINN